mgnify:CR=1 FL=1
MSQLDLVVIGSGPGGYVAAIKAAQLGLKVALVEKDPVLGGTCLNVGCIPSKALLHSTEVFHQVTHGKKHGLVGGEKVTIDVGAMMANKDKVVSQLNQGVKFLVSKRGIEIVQGLGRLDKQPGKVLVRSTAGERTLETKNIIIATGARPRVLPGLEPDGKLVWTYFEAMVPKAMPKSLLVVGSGAIGIEFASFYNSMGVDVTVVEVMDQIMPVEDAEISKAAQKQLEKQGLKFRLAAKVTKLDRHADSVTATIEAGGKTETITVDRVISAVGVQGNIEGLGLEALGVKTEKGCIVTDGYGRTNIPGVYAIGDVAGPPMLAHKAEHEGVICVEKIKGLDVHPMKKEQIPGCTYCHPQVASVGLTEAKAKAAGYELKVGRFPFLANGKAIALGEDQGLIKTIFDAKTGRLLGAHMVGAEVTELIQGFVIAMGLETTEEELMHTVFPHPTLSEMMHESVLDAYGRVIHM